MNSLLMSAGKQVKSKARVADHGEVRCSTLFGHVLLELRKVSFLNYDFNSIESDGIKNMAGSNSFSLTPKCWIERINGNVHISEYTGYQSGYFGNTASPFGDNSLTTYTI